MMTPKLDHAVINVRYQMDQAEELFTQLGFTLTARGYHSMGSINHLMMFDSDYLELIGLPDDSAEAMQGRPAIANAPLGINGLVFKTADADETFNHLQSIGMAADPPKSFSRPVALPESDAEARFRTVAVKDGVFPGGRVYYCEHATPELVWRPEWQQHDNGAGRVGEFVVVSSAHQQEAENFGRLLNTEVRVEADTCVVPVAGAQISLITPAAYTARFGKFASPMEDRNSVFGALVMFADNLEGIRSVVNTTANPFVDESDRVVVRVPAFNSLIEFRQSG